MICPHCGHAKSTCVDSRDRGGDRCRRHRCLACHYRWSTVEQPRVAYSGEDAVNHVTVSASRKDHLLTIRIGPVTRAAFGYEEYRDLTLRLRSMARYLGWPDEQA